jgi:Terminase RNaseH-like domain
MRMARNRSRRGLRLRLLKDAPVAVHAEAIKRRGAYPVSWPHDAGSREAGSGATVAAIYKQHGVAMLPERATFPDGGYSVEAGLLEMTERMQTGRLKVFSHLREWFEEFQLYHRKNGQVVKLQDDLMSATRYALRKGGQWKRRQVSIRNRERH